MPENVNTSTLALGETGAFDSSDERPTMIKVDHVSMVFNMASEQLNSLKEYAIQIARRKLFFQGFTALDDISFEVKKGDVFGIIGTNGSGKSTLLKIIAGVLDPTKGTCEINGNIAPLIELGAGFDDELSARENIYLNGALLGYSKTFIDEHFEEIVDFAEIEKFLDMPLKNYSSGMVARIAFAIATVIVPEILVVDEVLSVGDFMFQKKCEDRISELIERNGITVLIVSHSNGQIERLCNKAIWIEKGHTRILGDAAKVCRVYGGLGGRTGNLEAEQRVFTALHQTEPIVELEELCTEIAGENADSTNAKLVSRAWKSSSFDTVVIASGTAHSNAMLSNALASAYDAPVLTTKPDVLPDAVERILYDAKPTNIITVDCGSWAQSAFSQLRTLPWKPRIVTFENDGDLYELSWRIFDFGLERGFWSTDIALVDFSDNLESITSAPFLYGHRCPLIMTTGEGCDQDAESILRKLVSADRETLTVFGSTAAPGIEDAFVKAGRKAARITGSSKAEACLNISAFVFEHARTGDILSRTELCIANLSIAQWPELLACGSYAGKRRTALLLEDVTDLNSIRDCLDFVAQRRNELSALISIGGSLGLSKLDRDLLSHELLSNEEKGATRKTKTPPVNRRAEGVLWKLD